MAMLVSAMLALALYATAVQQSAPASDSQADVIEVVGTRATQAQKIDRRTYVVQTNPATAQKNTPQLLRGLPAVSIGPDDSISLLGSGATVTVDGQPYRGDLKNIHGSDIEKIEIITNPSAQYAAQGGGGIINLILRKKQRQGLSGNVALEGNSLGGLNGNGSVKLKRGKTRFEISPFFQLGTFDRSRTEKTRFVTPPSGVAPIGNAETITGFNRQNVLGTGATIARDLDDRTSLSLDAFAGGVNVTDRVRSSLIALTPGFTPYSQEQVNRQRFRWIGGNLSYNHKGKIEGEQLTASLGVYGNPSAGGVSTTQTSDGRRLVSDRASGNRFVNAKTDSTHPIGKRQILSLGQELTSNWEHSRYRLDLSGGGGTPLSFTGEYRGSNDTAAIYTTFQQRFGTWTILPGLRAEANRRYIASPGYPTARVSRVDLFPSLHVEHPLGKYWVLTFSRSSRIDRVGISRLRPYFIQQDPLVLEYGNPDLRDARTAGYEANLHYHRKKVDAGLILYDRRTSNVLSGRYTTNAAGQSIFFPLNIGNRRDRGAQADLSLPLVKRVKAQWSGNLFDSRVPIDIDSGATLSTLRTSSKLTLEYDGPERKGVPGDVVQLQWIYEGPVVDYQLRRRPYQQLTLTATHNFDAIWAVTATADSGLLGVGSRLDSPFIQQDLRTYYRASFKLKLMKSFGKK